MAVLREGEVDRNGKEEKGVLESRRQVGSRWEDTQDRQGGDQGGVGRVESEEEEEKVQSRKESQEKSAFNQCSLAARHGSAHSDHYKICSFFHLSARFHYEAIVCLSSQKPARKGANCKATTALNSTACSPYDVLALSC